MEDVRAYLLSVVAAAIISAITVHFVGKKDANSAVVKLLAGLFLSITVISPWTKIRIHNITSYFETFQADAADAVAAGTIAAESMLDSIIQEQTAAYILDKAATYGADINVDVGLSDTTPKTPHSVTIYGKVAPYAKSRLQNVIETELSIPKERQRWE